MRRPRISNSILKLGRLDDPLSDFCCNTAQTAWTSPLITAAMSVRRAAANLPSRSVHLRIVPRPANLSESREIFRLLQRFGDINTYKHLRVCPPTAATAATWLG
jgi:hypothetical protein